MNINSSHENTHNDSDQDSKQSTGGLFQKIAKITNALFGATETIPQSLPEIPLKRNTEMRERNELQREHDIIAIGDLHGNYQAFLDNLRYTKMIDRNKFWIGGNSVLILHGDILADRYTGGFDILNLVHTLKQEARKEGGDIIVFAGNHDDRLISFLIGRKVQGLGRDKILSDYCLWKSQGFGIAEFQTHGFFNVDIENNSPENIILAIGKNKLSHKEILGNMQNSKEGKILLEEICSLKLCEQIDDGLYLHCPLTDKILKTLEQYSHQKTLGDAIETLNSIWQKGLRQGLLKEPHNSNLSEGSEFNLIADIFLDTENRRASEQKHLYEFLKQQGINHIQHGHNGQYRYSSTFKNGILINDNDSGYGKNSEQEVDFACVKISKTGEMVKGTVSGNIWIDQK